MPRPSSDDARASFTFVPGHRPAPTRGRPGVAAPTRGLASFPRTGRSSRWSDQPPLPEHDPLAHRLLVARHLRRAYGIRLGLLAFLAALCWWGAFGN